jgi:ATP-binding cassette subfamily F protein 3
MVPHVRQLLGAFLFSGDAVDKPIRVLSGGERHRLALALLLLRTTNCLLLDEPTNHLDMTAKAVLLDALRSYTGTVVIVAHDRYILDELPEQVIEVGAGHATRYMGNYEDYLRQRAAELNGGSPHHAEVHDAAVADDDPPEAPAKSAPAPRPAGKADKKEARKEAKKKRDLEQTESAISEKESALSEIEAQINRPDFHDEHDNPQQVYSEYAKLKRDIEQLYGKLERLEVD